ncbi:hypothetical protein ACBJ59_10815 [Nonomuraea sp. MTCD27]|uniref:hypothetical protein n=1 Tax=Nonomuraea sp. MTCD27 TaxID=1676747 RepID=UPI0035C1FB18
MANPERDTTTEPEMLGDCLMHLTHHGMTSECWRVVIDHYMQAAGGREPEFDTVNSYKTTYERALLNAIRDEARNA